MRSSVGEAAVHYRYTSCTFYSMSVCLNVDQEEVALIKLSHRDSVTPVVLSTDFLFAGSI